MASCVRRVSLKRPQLRTQTPRCGAIMAEYGTLHRAITAPGDGTADLSRLLSQGSPINSKDQAGFTNLMAAIKAGKTERALHLVSNGAEIHCVNASGWSAFHLAASIGDMRVVKSLVQNAFDESIRALALALSVKTRSGSVQHFSNPTR